MGWTVIIGTGMDPCCQLVAERLKREGREVLYLTEEKLLPGLGFILKLSDDGAEGSISFGNTAVTSSEISGVLARHFGGVVSAEEYETRNGQYVSSEWHGLVHGWLSSLACPVINRLRPELWYKTSLTIPAVQAHVQGSGFKIPRACITTRIDQAQAFFRSCSGRMRYSPLAQQSAYLIDSDDDLEKLGALAGTVPFYLSEAPQGTSYRACVVGRSVVSMTDSTRLRLPERVERQCQSAAAYLHVTFCSLSLLQTSIDWYCLGIDLFPRLYDYSEEAQEEITIRLTELLTRGHES